MNFKIIKIIFNSGKKYLLFVFFATFLSLFSYTLGNNIIFSVNDFIKSQVKPIVGGDLIISGNNPIKDLSYLDKYKNNFEISSSIKTNSTIFDKDKNPLLTELVYHSDNYPFYNAFTYDIINNSGSIIVDKKVYDRVGKSIDIFGKNYQIKGIVTGSPLGNFSIYSSYLRIYLPIGEFPKNLNSTNSRLDYTYYLKFKGKYDSNYFSLIKNDENLKDFRIRSLEDREESIGNITDRFYLFINFFNLTIFILTFFIVILSLEIFFKKTKNTIGLLNIFGLQKSKIFFYYFLVLGIVFLMSFIISFLLNYIFIGFLKNYYDFFNLYSISSLKSIGVTILLFFIGIFSPFYKILKSKLSDLLNDSSNFSNFSAFDYIIYLSLIFFGFLSINLISGIDLIYSFVYSLIFLILIVFFYLFISFILNINFSFFSKISRFKNNFYLYDGIRSTIKPGNVSFLVIFSGIISFFSIFIFFVFSGSFLSYLENLTNTSNDTFVLNVGASNLNTVKKYFSDDEIYEIVTLKIKEINGKALENHLGVKDTPRQFSREFFSTTKNLLNKIVKGSALKEGGVSVDKEFASELGINLGDEITFTTAGLEKTLIVQNFREAVRDGTNPFFFFMLNKNDFEKYPKNYILSYKSSLKPQDIENTLYKEVGNSLTFINTKEIIDIILNVSKNILLIVYICLFYVLLFSFISFMVSVSFLKTFKISKMKTLNILGGEQRKLFSGLNFEYSYLIFIGLLISIIFGSMGLLAIFYFIKILSVSFFYYGTGIGILFGIFLIMFVYLYVTNKKNIKK